MSNVALLRTLRASDDPYIARIIRNSLEEFKANKPGTVYFDESTNHLSSLFVKNQSAYFILEIDGNIAGGGGIYPTEGLPEGTCELVKMYLAAAYRGKGFGKMILQKCIDTAKANGYTKMYIETMPELKGAIAMYEAFGFRFLQTPMGNSGHTGCEVWMIGNL